MEVEVDGRPSSPESEQSAGSMPPAGGVSRNGVRIMLDLRVSNGLRLRQGNLSYADLKRLVEKLEGLC